VVNDTIAGSARQRTPNDGGLQPGRQQMTKAFDLGDFERGLPLVPSIKDAVWTEWNAQDSDELSPVTVIAAKLDLLTADVAAIVCPLVEWSDDLEPLRPEQVEATVENWVGCTQGRPWMSHSSPKTVRINAGLLMTLLHAYTETVVEREGNDVGAWPEVFYDATQASLSALFDDEITD
jgi:hypothetical protein